MKLVALDSGHNFWKNLQNLEATFISYRWNEELEE